MLARESRARLLLWSGAALGLVLAVGSLALPAWRGEPELPSGAVAVVDGVVVPKGDYDEALRALSEGAQRAPTQEDRRAVVEQLVRNELLVAHGLELGMVRGDTPTRQALLRAVLTAERGAVDGRVPSDDELRRVYARIRTEIERHGKLHVRQIVVRALGKADQEAARSRAAEAARRLRQGETFENVRLDLGSPMERAVPDEPLDVDALRSLIGPLVLERVLSLATGEVSEPLGTSDVLRVIQLVEKRPPEVPSFEQARGIVLERYRQEAAQEGLATRLRALRDRARIRVVSTLP